MPPPTVGSGQARRRWRLRQHHELHPLRFLLPFGLHQSRLSAEQDTSAAPSGSPACNQRVAQTPWLRALPLEQPSLLEMLEIRWTEVQAQDVA
jgi:hypothetical protein